MKRIHVSAESVCILLAAAAVPTAVGSRAAIETGCQSDFKSRR